MSTSRLAVPAPPASSASDIEVRCLAASLTVVAGLPVTFTGPDALDVDGVIAGCAFDIVEIETHGAVIAVEQEARQGRGQHHGIAHRDVGRGAAEFGRGPRHRHHPRGAGEFRNVETDLGGAVGADRDDAGIQRQRLLRRRAALQLGAGGSPPVLSWPRVPCMPSINCP